MPTIVLNVPAGKTGTIQGAYGTYDATGTTVTVDVRDAQSLVAAGFTAVGIPDMNDESPEETVTLQVPAGSDFGPYVEVGGVNYLLTGNFVTVPRNFLAALVADGFTS